MASRKSATVSAPTKKAAPVKRTQDAALSRPAIQIGGGDVKTELVKALVERGYSLPSGYQVEILNWLITGQGDAIVGAVAGSGKTTTLKMISEFLVGSSLFCAFNKHIADELTAKLPKRVTVKTIHALGFAAVAKYIGKVKVDQYKYTDLVKDTSFTLCQSHYGSAAGENLEKCRMILSDLLKFSQSSLVDGSDVTGLEEIADHYGIETNGFDFRELSYHIASIQEKGKDMAKYAGIIDYVDMVWLPCVWNLSTDTFQYVLVDECQDLSTAQLSIALKARDLGGRMIFVGDSRQAIYGFAGADSYSYQRIQETTQAQEFPLSICYRCPKSHIALAQKLVPAIEAAPNAAEGVVETIKRVNLTDNIRLGDFVLSRKTAPLITAAIEMIANRIPARVKGRDIAKSLTKIVKEVGNMPGFTFANFPQYLDDYLGAKIDKLSRKPHPENQIQSLSDRCDGIMACYDAYEVSSISALCSEIEGLFSDEIAGVTLCTVHRAKGLEGERVFILSPQDLPLTWKKQRDWEALQEENLKYVALTRSKHYLCFVEDESKKQ